MSEKNLEEFEIKVKQIIKDASNIEEIFVGIVRLHNSDLDAKHHQHSATCEKIIKIIDQTLNSESSL